MKLLEYNMGEGVKAFSTTRDGGVSSGAYAGFNITHYCGDNPEAVARNRATLCAWLALDDDRLLLPRQTHGDSVLCVDEAFLARVPEERAALLHGVDAVVTNVPRLCIGVSTADCVPVLLYDAVRGCVAAVHAGWRGTLARIVEKAVRTMQQRYSCSSDAIKAVVGPSISPDAFEVGEEVYAAFRDAGFPMDSIARKYGHKWHIDLWEANRLQLLACGLDNEAVRLSGVCTYSRCDEFFSARRLGINSGRIFSGIMVEG
ncbi:MAG: peptidoglycan editing factor PgeF [Bacteroidaceae bacterium]|nr:peptidoglycan editing factor PgeF [Bacteroidaceae bacterium]